MSVIIHHRDGRDQHLSIATSCIWKPEKAQKNGNDASTRWLICQNARGDVVASFKEPDVLGYKITPASKAPRFRFPRLLNRTAS